MRFPDPAQTDTSRTFGFGDRLGLAGTGHIQASYRCTFTGVFAQHHVEDLRMMGSAPKDALSSVRETLVKARYPNRWAANAEGLRSVDDVAWVSSLGYSLYTVDLSAEVFEGADTLSLDALSSLCEGLSEEGLLDWETLRAGFCDVPFEVSELLTLHYCEDHLMRLAVKYARAVAMADRMIRSVRELNGASSEIEISFSGSRLPTTASEHLYLARQIKALGHEMTTFSPAMPLGWESVVDYRGSRIALERFLKDHVAVSYYEGPYKLGVDHGDEKFSVLPSIGLICGNLLHFKTSASSFLEGMRLVVRKHPTLFSEMVDFCLQHHDQRKYRCRCSLSKEDIEKMIGRTPLKDMEDTFIDQEKGRQLMEGMFGAIFSRGMRPGKGIPFKDAILDVLSRNSEVFAEMLNERIGLHVEHLSSG